MRVKFAVMRSGMLLGSRCAVMRSLALLGSREAVMSAGASVAALRRAELLAEE